MRKNLRRLILVAGVVGTLDACALSDLVSVDPPSTVTDPSVVTSRAGAVQLYNAAIGRWAIAYGGSRGSFSVVRSSGLFTDELLTVGFIGFGMDVRDGSNGAFLLDYISDPRTKAQQAREGLRLYYSDAPAAWHARLYAAEAYAVVWLAENFCSGVPLSSVSLFDAPQPSPGLTTDEMFERAIALFDSAATLAGDSDSLVNLARVGKARALLGLGRFEDAAAIARDVPLDFVYRLEFNVAVFQGANFMGNNPRVVQVVDQKGINGLVWSADPRAAITTTPSASGAMRISAKYSLTSTGTLDATGSYPNTPIRLADGLEARLIQAEADLAAGRPGWLSTLNTLRETCVGSAACAPVAGLTAAGLPPLSDPGTGDGRLDLLMTERAMWLFLTGHRLADLRRMVKFYGRDSETLFPVGLYENPGFPPRISASPVHGRRNYGTDVVMIPYSSLLNLESTNPQYQGCDNLDP